MSLLRRSRQAGCIWLILPTGEKKNYMYQAAGTNAEASAAMINESSGAVPGKGHVLVQLCLTHIDGLGDEKGGANFLLLACLFPATR